MPHHAFRQTRKQSNIGVFPAVPRKATQRFRFYVCTRSETRVVAVSPVQGYNDLVTANDKDELYRSAFVEAPTHCGFSIAETAVALEIMMRRLDSGRWEDTEPARLNELAMSMNVEGTVSRFIPFEPHENVKYNRTWLPN